jgi:hypothetical protein
MRVLTDICIEITPAEHEQAIRDFIAKTEPKLEEGIHSTDISIAIPLRSSTLFKPVSAVWLKVKLGPLQERLKKA